MLHTPTNTELLVKGLMAQMSDIKVEEIKSEILTTLPRTIS